MLSAADVVYAICLERGRRADEEPVYMKLECQPKPRRFAPRRVDSNYKAPPPRNNARRLPRCGR